jgi:hypothetical protein
MCNVTLCLSVCASAGVAARALLGHAQLHRARRAVTGLRGAEHKYK